MIAPWTPLLEQLAKKLPSGELRFDLKTREEHATDKWLQASHLPDAVALPRSVKSVSTILEFANQHRIPVTPRGAGCGYAGSCVPIRGGIVLSTARMRRIKEVNAADFVAVVQPGAITKTIQERVEKKGLFYPPDPASRADCSIGGNIATNAGGPRCLKYGVTRDYVLGLEVVLADGTIVRTGSRTHKNKTGFDLPRFFVGSEGMLGVITEINLKLIPLPPYRACLSVGFDSMAAAARTIRSIFAHGYLPSAVEIADSYTLEAAYKRTGNAMLRGCQGHLIVELDGQKKSATNELKELIKIVAAEKPTFLRKALGAEACESIWQLRREFSYALRDTGLQKLNEDITVPRGRLEDLFIFTDKLQKKYGVPIACFGHAGDGNIHANVMVDKNSPEAVKRSRVVLNELFGKILSWGGVITGEHGIGLSRKPWWNMATTPEVRQLHVTIKKALDPHLILNPGKFLDLD
jgi:glycolate oxidase